MSEAQKTDGPFGLVYREFTSSDLSPIAKVVYTALATYKNREGYCFPTRDQIAKNANVSLRHCSRSLSELEKAGWISRSKKQSGRNEYVVHTSPVSHVPNLAPAKSGTSQDRPVPCAKSVSSHVPNLAHALNNIPPNRPLEHTTSYASPKKRKQTPNQNQFWPTGASPPKEVRAKDTPKKEKDKPQMPRDWFDDWVDSERRKELSQTG